MNGEHVTDLLKDLESIYARDPGLVNEARLQDLRVASGLGWFGERLPTDVKPIQVEHRRIYRWTPSANLKPRPPALDFVYIRGGEMASLGSGRIKVEPFYRSAEPVSAALMDAFLVAKGDTEESVTDPRGIHEIRGYWLAISAP